MRAFFTKWLTPPTFEGDEEKNTSCQIAEFHFGVSDRRRHRWVAADSVSVQIYQRVNSYGVFSARPSCQHRDISVSA